MFNLKFAVADALVITKRNLIRYIRLPQLIVFSSVQPVMFLLLFNFVFGGAILLAPGQDYIDFFLPGIIIQTVLFGAVQASIGVAEDLNKGLTERLKSLPMARSAELAGRVIADSIRNLFVVIIMVAVGYMLGFNLVNTLPLALVAVLLALIFGFAFAWVAVYIGLSVKEVETAQVASFIWIFPLVFASSVFVPTSTMPDWLALFADNQPVTQAVNAARALTLGGSLDALWKALIWAGGITAVFLPISVSKYRKASS